ncbi:MAG: hypothetical protein JWL99_1425, partial [Streptomyces oryziradicis]|nr:hypothetical protein [Actinacidiphila oryziradicis]
TRGQVTPVAPRTAPTGVTQVL